MNNTKSEEYTKAFNEYYPAGHSNLKTTMDAANHRLFVKSAEGCHIWDVDDNEYIEYNGAMGPTFLGHRNPEYIQSLKEYMDTNATLYGSSLLYTHEDIELAEHLCKNVPCAEQFKFCVTGTEAVQMAIRIARAYTGKTKIIRFTGNYHGWLDNILGGNVYEEDIEYPIPVSKREDDVFFIDGRAPKALEDTFLLPWNDIEALEEIVSKYSDEIAVIHFEAVICNHFCMYPKDGFLEKIRELCDKYNIVMSMDEVITGFRTGIHGAQGLFNIIPDICTMAKAVSGGLPFSMVCGKKKIMSVLKEKRVLAPGTFNGYALGVHACLTNIKILERGEIYDQIKKVQQYLTDGILDVASKYPMPLCITEVPAVFHLLWGVEGGKRKIYTDDDVLNLDKEFTIKFRAQMQEEGILTMTHGRFYLGATHTIEDADKTIAAVDRILSKLLK